MKFIFNFIFFGLLFYVIWVNFPDAFATLLKWVEILFAHLKEIFYVIVEKVSSLSHNASSAG